MSPYGREVKQTTQNLGKVPRAVSVRGGCSDTTEEEEMCRGWNEPKGGEMAKTRHTLKGGYEPWLIWWKKGRDWKVK